MNGLRGPAYRIETARTRMRCLEPRHTGLLAQAIGESLAHLRPFMTWAIHEPISFEERLERLRTQRGHFDLGSDFAYGVFDKSESALLGVVALKLSLQVDERELGYWIHAAHTRRGLAYEATLAAVRVAFELEPLSALELRTEPSNVASSRLAQKLGFHGPVLEPLSYPAPEGKRDIDVYGLSRVEYASSPAREATIEAYDVLERRLL